jgi:hypothetical protein
MTAKKSRKEQAEFAVRTVLKNARRLINKIPGKSWQYQTKDPVSEFLRAPVAKVKILSVFEWIVRKTKGFRVPIMVNFSHGEAPIIGLCFCFSQFRELSSMLYSLHMHGVPMPCISTGWHHGPHSPFIFFSDLLRKQRAVGETKGVSVISIHGKIELPKHTVLLEDIIV